MFFQEAKDDAYKKQMKKRYARCVFKRETYAVLLAGGCEGEKILSPLESPFD